ncbi:MAG: CarD family transcriptional regulator [Desulfobulbaceae bacterium]|nr:CarD family transcriptional regulator [Desulfobulbaceae bacterium]
MAKKKSASFQVGDMAVYPAHGVGRIDSIETRSVGDLHQSFYVINIIETKMTIMIPTNSCDNVGLRAIIKADEVDEIYSILKDRDVTILPQPWNQRYREYMEKIKTGSVYEIARVLRDLYILQVDKTLSFGERKMLDTAQGLLVKEISIANRTHEDAVSQSINHIFS